MTAMGGCDGGERMNDKIAEELFDFDDDDDEDDPIAEAMTDHTVAVAKALREAVLSALEELVSKEHVEIAPESMGLVADELTLAAHDARDPRHALKKLRGALIDSDNVEEVYADNRVLEAAFRHALGG